jgi:hypothetical protein
VEIADDVFDPLVRDDPADEEDVRPVVVELAAIRSFGSRSRCEKSGTTGRTPVG